MMGEMADAGPEGGWEACPNVVLGQRHVSGMGVNRLIYGGSHRCQYRRSRLADWKRQKANSPGT
jgi:hypothetical protein